MATMVTTIGAPAGMWKHTLMGCFDDCNVCCTGVCCTPCMYGATDDMLRTGVQQDACCDGCGLSCGLFALCSGYFAPCLICVQRGNVRAKYGIPGDSCTDFLVGFCCWPCANCQNWKEVRPRPCTVCARARWYLTHTAPAPAQPTLRRPNHARRPGAAPSSSRRRHR